MVNSEQKHIKQKGFHHYGWIGFICGALALGISIVHFYTGPLVKEPSLSQVATQKVMSLKQKALSKFKGDKQTNEKPNAPEAEQDERWNLDEKLDLSAVILGFLALVFASVAFIRHENIRASGMAGAFGVGTILFQFLNWAIAFAAVIAIIGITFFKLAREKKHAHESS